MDGFNSILDPIDLPMNRLDDTFDFSRDSSDVATDGSHLEAYGINQFLCFMAVLRTWRRTGMKKMRSKTRIAAMTVTLMVNSIARVGFIITSFFRLLFLL